MTGRNLEVWKRIYCLFFALLIVVVILVVWLVNIINLPSIFKNDLGDYTFNYFSFFTIQSNILVAFYFLAVAFSNNRIKNKWFLSYNFALGISSYISITFLIYNTMLLPSHIPNSAFDWIQNVILHIIIPISMVGYFLFLMPTPINVKNFNQMWRKTGYKFYFYPVIYFIFNLVRGQFRSRVNKPIPYPYFFLNVNQTGPLHVPGYIWLIIAIIVISLLLFLFTTLYNLYHVKKMKNK